MPNASKKRKLESTNYDKDVYEISADLEEDAVSILKQLKLK